MVQDYTGVPASTRQMHFYVNIPVYIMYINYLQLLVTVSQKLKYIMSMFIKIRKRSRLVEGITKVIQINAKYDFACNCINEINEFEARREDYH